MPILEFRCNACGKAFEWLKISARETPVCPDCGSAETTRLLSVFAVGSATSSRSVPEGACRVGARGSCAGEYSPGCMNCAHAGDHS